MNITRYFSIGLAVAVVAAVFSFGSLTRAQTAPLMCTANTASVTAGSPQTFTVSGGNGTYQWTAQSGATSTSGSGTNFTVNYPTSGTYTVTVTSGNSTANCFAVVNPVTSTTTTTTGTTNTTTTTNAPLACAPVTQTTDVNVPALFTATGGNGSYTWSGQNLNVINPTGTGFQVTYPSAGTYLITVASNGQTANCSVNVIDPSLINGGTIVPPVILAPALPNTGFQYEGN